VYILPITWNNLTSFNHIFLCLIYFNISHFVVLKEFFLFLWTTFFNFQVSRVDFVDWSHQHFVAFTSHLNHSIVYDKRIFVCHLCCQVPFNQQWEEVLQFLQMHLNPCMVKCIHGSLHLESQKMFQLNEIFFCTCCYNVHVTCVFGICFVRTNGVHKSSCIVCLVEVNDKGDVGNTLIFPLGSNYTTWRLNTLSFRDIMSRIWRGHNIGRPPMKESIIFYIALL